MRLPVIIGACALLLGAPSLARAQNVAQKFAFINSQAFLQAAPGAAEAQLQLQKELETMRTQVA